MATLADINKTLQQQITLMLQQQEVSEKTSQGIESVKNRIADVLNQQKSDKLDKLEQARESKSKLRSAPPTGFAAGLTQGSGTSGLASMLSGFLGGMFSRAGGLVGMLTGALGLAAGKAIKWTLIGGLIMSFFGEEILAFAEGLENLTGIDLNLDNPANLLALTVAIGAIVPALLRTATKWILKSIGSVALLALRGAGKGISNLATTATSAAARMLPTRPGQAAGRVAASVADDAAVVAARLAEQRAASAAAKASERAGAAKLFSKTGKPLAGTAADAVRRKLMRDAEAASIKAAEASAARKAAEATAKGTLAPVARSFGLGTLGKVLRAVTSGPAMALQLVLTPSEIGVDGVGLDMAIDRMFEEKGARAINEVRALLKDPAGQAQIKMFGNNYPHWNKILTDDTFANQYAAGKFRTAHPAPFQTPSRRIPATGGSGASAGPTISPRPGTSGSALGSVGGGSAGGVTVNNFYGGPGGSSGGGSAVPIPVPAVAAYTVDLMDGGGRRYGPQ